MLERRNGRPPEATVGIGAEPGASRTYVLYKKPLLETKDKKHVILWETLVYNINKMQDY